MATFRKGDLVFLLQNWDRQGTVSITEAIVYACGKKQMVLTHMGTGEELGRNFLPGERQNNGRVMIRTVRADAEAAALELAAEVLDEERAGYADRLARWGDTDTNYRAAIEKAIAALHEPRVIWR